MKYINRVFVSCSLKTKILLYKLYEVLEDLKGDVISFLKTV